MDEQFYVLPLENYLHYFFQGVSFFLLSACLLHVLWS